MISIICEARGVKSRVILDGTGNAQNVPDIGSVVSLDGCLLAVHDYSFFGSDTWTSASQWVSQFKGEVGNYSDRTVCTEWGGPMSPGSKNGVSYGSLDYSKAPTNYFEAYLQGMSSQLRAWNMGSFYWVGLKDGDWYSMTTRSGTGANLTLSVPNPSGLAELQNAWTGPPPGSGDAGVDGITGGGGSAAGAGGGNGAGGRGSGMGGAGSGGRSGGGGATLGGGGGATGGSAASGGAGGGRAGAGGTGTAGGGSGGTLATGGTTGGTTGGAGGTIAGTGGTIAGTGGTTGGTGGTTGGTGGTTPVGGGGRTGSEEAGSASSGCSCAIGQASPRDLSGFAFLFGPLALSALVRSKRRPREGRCRAK